MNLILATVAAALLGACSSHASVDNSNKGSLDTGAVIQRVEEIYGAVFKVYNEEDSLRNLDIQMENGVYDQRGDFIGNYCSREWNELVNKVDEIDSLYHSDELGFWEADYWIMGQDWHALSISDVKVIEMTETEATVELKLHNFDSAKPVSLKMVNENGVWKIDAFVDKEYDLNWKQSMQEYVAEESAKTKN